MEIAYPIKCSCCDSFLEGKFFIKEEPEQYSYFICSYCQTENFVVVIKGR